MTNQEKSKVDQLREALKSRKEAEGKGSMEPPEAPRKPDEAQPSDDLAAQIHAAEEEAKAHYDKLLRVMAEFENYKKRNEREKSEAIKFANERLLEELLPVLDHLDEALATVQGTANGGEAVRGLSEGVDLVRRQFLNLLGKYGLEPIEPEKGTAFDPARHEAMAQVAANDVAAGAVVTCHRRGYLLHGRLLRAALVSVAKSGE